MAQSSLAARSNALATNSKKYANSALSIVSYQLIKLSPAIALSSAVPEALQIHITLSSHQECLMQDPVDRSPAVLVKRYNVTEQKELELQLSDQQEALQK